MRINNNVASLNTYNRLSANESNTSKSLEKLSSGLRINKAGDDAAGLAISEKMRGQIRGLNQASRNAQDGISLIQTAEGALNETHSILQRMRELAVQGGNDTLQGPDRNAIATELTQLTQEIDGIANRTKFNGQSLLTGGFGLKELATSTLTVTGNVTALDVSGAKTTETYTFTAAGGTYTTVSVADSKGNTQVVDAGAATGVSKTLNFDKLGISITLNNSALNTDLNNKKIVTATSGSENIQIGANNGENLSLTINDMTSTGLSINSTTVDVSDSIKAASSINNIETAIGLVSTQRANLGAYQNRLEHTINNLSTSSENLTASESRIRDVDMAQEMMNYTKNNILTQAATAMLAQANQAPQGVLQLLR